MAFFGLLGFVFLITLNASRWCYDTESGSVHPAVLPVGNGLDRQDRSPGVVICLGMRSLTAGFVASTRVTATSDHRGLMVAAINGFRVLRGFLRRSPDKYYAATSRLGDADPAEAERHKRVPQPQGEIEPAIPVRVREVGIPTHTTHVPGWARAFVGCRLLSR
jgi:hypothetical protein